MCRLLLLGHVRALVDLDLVSKEPHMAHLARQKTHLARLAHLGRVQFSCNEASSVHQHLACSPWHLSSAPGSGPLTQHMGAVFDCASGRWKPSGPAAWPLQSYILKKSPRNRSSPRCSRLELLLPWHFRPRSLTCMLACKICRPAPTLARTWLAITCCLVMCLEAFLIFLISCLLAASAWARMTWVMNTTKPRSDRNSLSSQPVVRRRPQLRQSQPWLRQSGFSVRPPLRRQVSKLPGASHVRG